MFLSVKSLAIILLSAGVILTMWRRKFNYASKENEEQPTLLLEFTRVESGERNTWYLDTVASNHMCKRDIFVELDELIKGNITLRDESKIPMK